MIHGAEVQHAQITPSEWIAENWSVNGVSNDSHNADTHTRVLWTNAARPELLDPSKPALNSQRLLRYAHLKIGAEM